MWCALRWKQRIKVTHPYNYFWDQSGNISRSKGKFMLLNYTLKYVKVVSECPEVQLEVLGSI
jgi:hypothetical protein